MIPASRSGGRHSMTMSSRADLTSRRLNLAERLSFSYRFLVSITELINKAFLSCQLNDFATFPKAHSDTIGDKVVVFSQCLKTLDFIEEILQSPDWGGFVPYLPDGHKKFGSWKLNSEYSRIDGSVNANTRGELISTFNTVEHSKVFLVSTLAGGLGINLVAANRVVLLDTHWNPAISDQAVHRCYRIGQAKVR